MTAKRLTRICSYVGGTILLILGTASMYNNYRRYGDSSSWPILVNSIGITLILTPYFLTKRDQDLTEDEDPPDRPDLDP